MQRFLFVAIVILATPFILFFIREGKDDVVFTHDITNLNKVELIQPPGGIEEYEGEKITKTHSYIVVEEKVPVYAPVDSRLFRGAYYEEEEMYQYSAFFEVNSDIHYMFDHIQDPVDKLAEAINMKPTKDTHTIEVEEPVEFKAGELVGYTKGTKNAHHFDFGVYKKEKALCPYDFFEQKEKYYKLFGTIRYEDEVATLFCK